MLLGVYTRVKAFVKWIKKNVKDGFCTKPSKKKKKKRKRRNRKKRRRRIKRMRKSWSVILLNVNLSYCNHVDYYFIVFHSKLLFKKFDIFNDKEKKWLMWVWNSVNFVCFSLVTAMKKIGMCTLKFILLYQFQVNSLETKRLTISVTISLCNDLLIALAVLVV